MSLDVLDAELHTEPGGAWLVTPGVHWGVYRMPVWKRTDRVVVVKIPGTKQWTSQIHGAHYVVAHFIVFEFVTPPVGAGRHCRVRELVQFPVRS